MNNNNFYDKLSKELNNEEITLPESLSAENIERLINEKGSIVQPFRVKEKKRTNAIKVITSVAAMFLLAIGITSAVGVTADKLEQNKQDKIIAEYSASSDYREVENAVFGYYKKIFNENSKNNGSIFNKFQNVDDFLTGSSTNKAESIEDGLNFSESTDQSTTSDYNKTNVQVEGVDEGDIIKNDGRYIYYMTNSKIVVSDCLKPEKMNIVSEIDFNSDDNKDYSAADMYIYKNKLVVILNQYENKTVTGSNEEIYDCCIVSDYDTVIKVYDISNKAAPKLCYSQFTSGMYNSSRIVNGKLIAVTNYNIPYENTDSNDFEKSCEKIKNYIVPEYSVNGSDLIKIPSERIGLLDKDEPTEYMVTAVIDLNNDTTTPLMNGYLGGADEIYCTENEIFIGKAEFSYWENNGTEFIPCDNSGNQFSTVTHIYKFDITDEGVIYKSEAKVGGGWLNQFSMDKQGDYFRLVTNGSKVVNGKYQTTESMVYIFDKSMKVVGSLDSIAMGEDIKSSKFLGDTLYLVTFYQTDPLFVIDLSDVTAPKIKGELKITGFSSYLHPVGENLVIGIGSGGTSQGVDGSAKISLFDVSDPYNPKEIDNYTVNDAYFDTSHKAFTVIDDTTFAISCIRYSTDRYYNYMEYSSSIVFNVDNEGLIIHGEYDGCTGNSDEYNYCSFRSAFIGNTLFAVNNYGIRAYDMNSNKLLGELNF